MAGDRTRACAASAMSLRRRAVRELIAGGSDPPAMAFERQPFPCCGRHEVGSHAAATFRRQRRSADSDVPQTARSADSDVSQTATFRRQRRSVIGRRRQGALRGSHGDDDGVCSLCFPCRYRCGHTRAGDDRLSAVVASGSGKLGPRVAGVGSGLPRAVGCGLGRGGLPAPAAGAGLPGARRTRPRSRESRLRRVRSPPPARETVGLACASARKMPRDLPVLGHGPGRAGRPGRGAPCAPRVSVCHVHSVSLRRVVCSCSSPSNRRGLRIYCEASGKAL